MLSFKFNYELKGFLSSFNWCQRWAGTTFWHGDDLAATPVEMKKRQVPGNKETARKWVTVLKR